MVGNDIVCTVLIKPEEHLVYGAEAISKIIKYDQKEFRELVAKRGLKIWQSRENGKWKALCSDLIEFNAREKERFLG